VLEVLEVDSTERRQVEQFIDLPFRLYQDTPQWVPPFRSEIRKIVTRRHPFFEHSAASFYLARRRGRTVGRISVFENRRLNSYRDRREARFHHFECAEDEGAAAALLEAAEQWAKGRGLVVLAGPHGLSGMDGSGVQIDGFEHRATMTMMHYNKPYYRRFFEAGGFEKVRDYYTAEIERQDFSMPEKIRRVAEIHYKRGHFRVPRFRSKRAIKRIARQIGEVYNRSFDIHEDFCPLQEAEIDRLAQNLTLVSKPSLIKILYHDERIVGFLFAFPDLSAALQRAGGRLTPFGMLDLLTEAGRTDRLIVNGAAILPEYQKLGGNGLLYYELIRTILDSGYQRAEMVQIADTTSLMLADMQTLGGRVYKTHRIYRREL
jgi:GNAT superfamily N-acetyltransferase